ncbi:MAG: HAD family phosphatase [Lachnospiraceae bacterium]|nr:HAD family phosphatase [Lachnospiraceae bacterium]
MRDGIRNLIFDVGSVLIGYRWKEMLLINRCMSPERAQVFGSTVLQDPMWALFDLDELPEEEIVAKYVEKYPDFAEDFRWFVKNCHLMPTMRPRVWEEVHRLKVSGYRIYLLSNYSKRFFTIHTKDASFFDDLDGMMVSYMVHQIKPNPPIYQALLDRYDLNPGECIFFDDKAENTQTAETLGMDILTVESEEHLLDFLRKIC